MEVSLHISQLKIITWRNAAVVEQMLVLLCDSMIYTLQAKSRNASENTYKLLVPSPFTTEQLSSSFMAFGQQYISFYNA